MVISYAVDGFAAAGIVLGSRLLGIARDSRRRAEAKRSVRACVPPAARSSVLLLPAAGSRALPLLLLEEDAGSPSRASKPASNTCACWPPAVAMHCNAGRCGA